MTIKYQLRVTYNLSCWLPTYHHHHLTVIIFQCRSVAMTLSALLTTGCSARRVFTRSTEAAFIEKNSPSTGISTNTTSTSSWQFLSSSSSSSSSFSEPRRSCVSAGLHLLQLQMVFTRLLALRVTAQEGLVSSKWPINTSSPSFKASEGEGV